MGWAATQLDRHPIGLHAGAGVVVAVEYRGVELDRFENAAEPAGPFGNEPNGGRLADLATHGLGEQNLTAGSRSRDTGGPVDDSTEVVAGSLLGRTGMQANPDTQLERPGPRGVADHPLDVDCGGESVGSAIENRRESVAEVFDDRPTRTLDGGLHQPVVGAQGLRHRVGIALPQPGRPLQV